MTTILIVLAIIAAVGIFLSVPRFRRATQAATPMGNYLRAREKGATAEEAIYDSLRILRYRQPWSGLSEDDLAYAARALGSLPEPKVFAALVVEVEEKRSLQPITDRAVLDQFVRGARVTHSPASR